MEKALATFCDLTGPVKKKMLTDLAGFCTDPQQREEMEKMAAKNEEGEKLFEERVGSCMLTVIELLERYDSVKVPLGCFLQIVPRLAPRYYTIASSCLLSPERVRMAISLTVDTLKGSGQ